MEHVWHYNTYFFFPAQCNFFILGALLHHFYERFRASSFLPQWGRMGWVLVIVSILSIGWFKEPYIKYGFYTMFCLSLPAIFAFSKQWKMDRHIGNLSYSVYLLHMLVLSALQSGLKIHNGTLGAILTIIGAIGIYVLLEQPIDAYRQGLVSRNTARQAKMQFLSASDK